MTTTTPTTTAKSSNSTNAKSKARARASAKAATQSSSPAPISLPPLDAPALSPQQPSLSYKLAFADTSCWYCSSDGGHSSTATASAAIAGTVLDLALQITPARHRDGEDVRLRLAFLNGDGVLAELNLNAVSIDASGAAYITSPARSLAGALLTISDNEDDRRAFCAGARFSIRKGQGRGVFVETDIAVDGRWLAMSGAIATLRIDKAPDRFCQQLIAIKQRFRADGLLLAGPAVLHTAASAAAAASAALPTSGELESHRLPPSSTDPNATHI